MQVVSFSCLAPTHPEKTISLPYISPNGLPATTGKQCRLLF